nr:AlpA family phage regulatory protein [Nitrosomonas nitrosa]
MKQQSIEFKPKKQILAQLAISHTNFYKKIREGKFPRPIKIGKRSLWPSHEVDAMCAAWIAGHDDTAIKQLVAEIEKKRKIVTA